MKENQMQATPVHNEGAVALSTLVNNNGGKNENNNQHTAVKDVKPVYQTYIYRSHGGGYQGL